jgi:Tol biopolymer transport system component
MLIPIEELGMKPAKRVRIITMVLSLTFAVTVQLVLPGQPQPGQPVISLDFAQYCIGDSWTLKLSNGVPNTSTRLSGSSNGQSWEITDWRKTDAAGNLSEGGTFPAEAVGSHTLMLDIAGTVSNSISFVVSGCSRLKGRIAFVSTRDGGGGPAGPESVPYIYLANPDGSGVTRLTRGAMPTWSADGQRIAFHSWSGGAVNRGSVEIRVIDADGSNERVLGPGGNPSWSPDGTKIVFVSDATRWPEGGISMMNADGSSVTQLISHEFASPGGGDYAVSLPTWSPDGRSIAFVRTNYEDLWSVHILDLAKSETSHLSIREWVGQSRPVWSPDGTRLLLQVSGCRGIASINRNGSGLRGHLGGNYMGQGTNLGNPDWSPDGKSIVFNMFTGPGDQRSPLGTRMRIFVASLEGFRASTHSGRGRSRAAGLLGFSASVVAREAIIVQRIFRNPQ